MLHTCHALGCDVPVPERILMHRDHWFALPVSLRRAVLAAYVPGQERTKRPSRAYLHAAARAIVWLAEREGREVPPVYRRMAAGDAPAPAVQEELALGYLAKVTSEGKEA